VPISFDHVDMSGPPSVDEPEVSAAERARATRVVASAAKDAADCALLLDVLGLRAEEGLPARSAAGGAGANV
jgi:hypothetical protein